MFVQMLKYLAKIRKHLENAGKKRWRRPWNCQKPEIVMLNSQKFHQMPKLFHQMPKYLVKMLKCLVKHRIFGENSKIFTKNTKNYQIFHQIPKYFVKFRKISPNFEKISAKC